MCSERVASMTTPASSESTGFISATSGLQGHLDGTHALMLDRSGGCAVGAYDPPRGDLW
jgi:hypothetical protein